MPALLLLADVVNAAIGFVTARSADPTILPSRVLLRMADDAARTRSCSASTTNGFRSARRRACSNALDSVTGDRRRLFHDLAYALLDVLVIYGETLSTFFHGMPHREEWRATFDVFIESLWMSVQNVDV